MFYTDEFSESGFDYISGEFVYGDQYYTPENYLDERWWFISGIPGYMISDHGRVWSERTQRFLKPKPMDNHGHLGVSMRVGGRTVYRYIHQLMAQAYLPNPNDLPIVRHLDDDPSNNYLDNLQWGTQKDNYEDCRRNGHAHYITPEEREIGLGKMRIPILATNISTGQKTRFVGQSEAARTLGIQQANIWKVLNGQRTATCGYYFEYLRKDDQNEYN